MVGGCFDVLHYGHIYLLEQAKKLGDRLIVAINSDASVKKLKGSKRPVFPASVRKKQLLALKAVDEVVIFKGSSPKALLARLKPNVFVKGKEYKNKPLLEQKVCDKLNIEIIFIDDSKYNYSTSKLIK